MRAIWQRERQRELIVASHDAPGGFIELVLFLGEIACWQAHLRMFSSKKAKTSGSQVLTPW
jgi:hypothetical protein